MRSVPILPVLFFLLAGTVEFVEMYDRHAVQRLHQAYDPKPNTNTSNIPSTSHGNARDLVEHATDDDRRDPNATAGARLTRADRRAGATIPSGGGATGAPPNPRMPFQEADRIVDPVAKRDNHVDLTRKQADVLDTTVE